MFTVENINTLNQMGQAAVKTGLLAEESLKEMLSSLKARLLNSDEKEEYLTMTELTQVLKISRPTIYRLIACGKLKARKVGSRQNRFSLSEIRKYMAT